MKFRRYHNWGFYIKENSIFIHKKTGTITNNEIILYSVRGLERSELGGSHGCPGRLWDLTLTGLYSVQSIVPTIDLVDLS